MVCFVYDMNNRALNMHHAASKRTSSFL